jgi:hypothetical protein
MNPTITRKEIAKATGVSERTVKRKEKEWGLSKCRSKASERPLFFLDPANRELMQRGIILRPIVTA